MNENTGLTVAIGTLVIDSCLPWSFDAIPPYSTAPLPPVGRANGSNAVIEA